MSMSIPNNFTCINFRNYVHATVATIYIRTFWLFIVYCNGTTSNLIDFNAIFIYVFTSLRVHFGKRERGAMMLGYFEAKTTTTCVATRSSTESELRVPPAPDSTSVHPSDPLTDWSAEAPARRHPAESFQHVAATLCAGTERHRQPTVGFGGKLGNWRPTPGNMLPTSSINIIIGIIIIMSNEEQ